MTEENSVQGSAVITHEIGLHARPSVKLTKLAKTFASRILIAAHVDGPWIDAKSVVKVMGMKTPSDTELYFRADGVDADAALSALVKLVSDDFQGGPA
jgi:phosphocarrier protein